MQKENKKGNSFCQQFYEYLFGEEIDWPFLYREYCNAIYNSNPLVNAIPHLGETISFTIKDNHRIIEIKNVKIVGVEAEFGFSSEYFYANRNMQGLENINVCKKIVSKVDWQNNMNRKPRNNIISGVNRVGNKWMATLTYKGEFVLRKCLIFRLASWQVHRLTQDSILRIQHCPLFREPIPLI